MKIFISRSGKKIVFRSPTKNDLKAIYQFAKAIEAENTFILLNPDEPITLKEEKVFFQSLLQAIRVKKKIYLCAIYQNNIIGSCGIAKSGRRQGHIGIFGISLLKPYRSESIGSQLAKTAINLAKKQLNVTQISLECFANNIIGLNLYKKLGFKTFGRHPQAVKYQGKLIDKILFYKNI